MTGRCRVRRPSEACSPPGGFVRYPPSWKHAAAALHKSPRRLRVPPTGCVCESPTAYAMALAGLACGGFSIIRRRKQA